MVDTSMPRRAPVKYTSKSSVAACRSSGVASVSASLLHSLTLAMLSSLLDDELWTLKAVLAGCNVVLFVAGVVTALRRARRTPLTTAVLGNDGGRCRADGDDVALVVVTAHPDDEVMFFAPLLLHWPGPKSVCCLSDGGYDGLGKVRSKELERVGSELGLARVDVGPLPDGPNEEWRVDDVVPHVEAAVRAAGGDDGVEVVVASFDDYGVSGHVNHRAVARAVASMAEAPPRGVVALLALDSVSWSRKYLGWLALLPLLYLDALDASKICVVSGPRSWLRALSAMRIHASQMVWFRWLYIGFASYMFANVFRTLVPSAGRRAS